MQIHTWFDSFFHPRSNGNGGLSIANFPISPELWPSRWFEVCSQQVCQRWWSCFAFCCSSLSSKSYSSWVTKCLNFKASNRCSWQIKCKSFNLTRLWHTEIPLTPGYDAHEFFAGAKAVSDGLHRASYRTSSHDVGFHRSMDILEPSGFLCWT